MTLTLNTTDVTTQRASFFVSRSLIRENPLGVAEAFAALKLLPYRIDDDFERGALHYYAFSPYFRTVEPACNTPEVQLTATRVGFEVTYSFKYQDNEDTPMTVARRYPLERC